MQSYIMPDIYNHESGFITPPDKGIITDAGMTDIEVLSASRINLMARGRRYGRLWLLKGLIPDLRDSPSARRQLQKEFEIHSRLLHPGIARAVGFENIEGVGLCIVEEWIEGKTLAQMLHEGKISKQERRRIMADIIRAVGFMHGKGVMHRDLKPANVMVRKEGGEIVLIDFGL
ncbi:MAG: protein kinase, partial [Muribaculaceae bacterium]|nr:protein kinase [Muribaculaceae bacterium]